jgi:hypothetical protein
VLGAPIDWHGRNLADAHDGLNIIEADFNKFVAEIIVATLREMRVHQELIDETVMALLSMRTDIIGK